MTHNWVQNIQNSHLGVRTHPPLTSHLLQQLRVQIHEGNLSWLASSARSPTAGEQHLKKTHQALQEEKSPPMRLLSKKPVPFLNPQAAKAVREAGFCSHGCTAVSD